MVRRIVGEMPRHLFVSAVVAAVMVCLVCAADTGHAAHSDPEGVAGNNVRPEGSTRTRSYRDNLFSWNYEKVEAASEGWKAGDVRGSVMSVMMKLYGAVYTTVSAALKVKSYVSEANKFVERAKSENEAFQSRCALESVNVIGLKRCTVSNLVLETMSLSASTAGAITEAYVRTRLNSSSDAFKTVTDGMFLLITETVSTELVMLRHLVKMVIEFINAIVARYFNGFLPVKGTETDFVKACDNLYAAVSDFFLMSRMVIQHTLNTFHRDISSTAVSLAPEFKNYFENVMRRGITEQYAASPFPPLSYYWDMAALEYAVAVLIDMNVTATVTLNEVVDHGTDDIFHNKAFISNVAYTASASLNDTTRHLTRDELKNALDSAIGGLRMAVYAYHEARLDMPREKGSEALMDNIYSFLESLKQISLIGLDKVKFASGMTSLFGVSSQGLVASYSEIFNYRLPADYDHLMTMVTQVTEGIAHLFMKGYRLHSFMGNECLDDDAHKPQLAELVHLVKRQILNLHSSPHSGSQDSEPGIAEHSYMPEQRSFGDRLTKTGVWTDEDNPRTKEFINILLKYVNVDFLAKMKDLAACEADSECRQTFITIATKIGQTMGIDVVPGSLTPLSPPIEVAGVADD